MATAPDVILLKRAVLAFRSGDKLVARELLAEAAEHNPDNELVWLWRASAARTRTEAFEAVERVLQLNPGNEKALQWIAKLRPGYVPPPKRDAEEEQTPVRNGALNGHAAPEEAEEGQSAQAAAVEEAREENVEEKAAEEEVVEAAADEAAQAGAANVEEASAESDAESRLAVLEADLEQDARGDSEAAVEDEQQQVEGYGLGTHEDGQAESTEDGWNRLRGESGDSGREESEAESADDPLAALMRMSQEAERAGLPAEARAENLEGLHLADDPRDREYSDRLAELERAKASEADDVWASLGMAGMGDSTPAVESLAKDGRARGAAVGSGFAETAGEDETVTDGVPPVLNEEDAEDEIEACFICEKLAPQQEGLCSSCRSIVDLKLLDLAPRHDGADRGQLTAALERLRDEIAKGPTSQKKCVQAALICLNLKQSQQALLYLREACRLTPHDRELVGYYDQLEKRPLILAVDDSKTVQKMISTVLEKESYRVSAAEDGLSAIAKLDEEMPKLILLDITMPRMDGYQVCKVINGNESTKHIPVIMLSGKDGFFDKVRGKMVGASNYITKPFDPNELTKTIAKFLKN
jgi:twitching motility two-component system response regulator PilG